MKTPPDISSLNKSTVLLSTAYLPNIQYFSKLFSYSNVLIEGFDTYQKQSYRNRAVIYGANGKQDLVIPVKFSYDSISGLSAEVREKLKLVAPRTLGQAGRIPGVTPAAVAILAVLLRR